MWSMRGLEREHRRLRAFEFNGNDGRLFDELRSLE